MVAVNMFSVIVYRRLLYMNVHVHGYVCVVHVPHNALGNRVSAAHLQGVCLGES